MIVSTTLYSNTTLVSLLPTLALGATAVLLGEFDERRVRAFASGERETHAMLVPVQYQRILADPPFDIFDLSAFRLKTCTSAPFSADLNAEILRRWPGDLLEFYAMTESGATCVLPAHDYPEKLHTVGRPAPGSDIRTIDEQGREASLSEVREIVGRSDMMMNGYHGRPDATAEANWHDADGNRFIRHGDIGRFGEDEFLTLLGRAKDMIISGGFNIYPPDLESAPALGRRRRCRYRDKFRDLERNPLRVLRTARRRCRTGRTDRVGQCTCRQDAATIGNRNHRRTPA